MTTNVHWKRWRMRNSGRMLLIALAGLACASPALADDEASNVAHVTAGPYGRCYAKSVPKHIRDPQGEPRQQGVTRVYRVGDTKMSWSMSMTGLANGYSSNAVPWMTS